MATTTNYGWTTPDDTALVSQGASAIRTLGSSVDTTVKALSPGTTAGDVDYYTSSTAKARLGIGSTGQVLTVAAGVPSWAAVPTEVASQTGNSGKYLTTDGTNTSWATVSASNNWSLLNAGGTALSGATTTISGISGKDKIMILWTNVSSNGAAGFSFRLNGDTGSNYYNFGWGNYLAATYNVANLINSSDVEGSALTYGGGAYFANAASVAAGYVQLSGCNTSGVKVFEGVSGTGGGSTGATTSRATKYGGYYNSSSTISSISLRVDSGSFDAGTVFVYASA